MRPDPVYTPGSAYHQQRRWTHTHTIRCLETAFDELGQPESLLDVGCGADGVLVQWAQRVGIDAYGVDIGLPIGYDGGNLARVDLCQPLDLGRTFQWVLCWEVAEHLPAAVAETLTQTLATHLAPGGRLIFTAARPGQSGPGHINCQPASYWTLKCAEIGLMLADEPTAQLRQAWMQCAPRTPWYGRNVMVFWWVG